MAPVRATRKEKEKITQNVEKKFINSFNNQTSGETGLLFRFQPVGFTDWLPARRTYSSERG